MCTVVYPPSRSSIPRGSLVPLPVIAHLPPTTTHLASNSGVWLCLSLYFMSTESHSMSPFVSAAFAQHDACVNCPCNCSSRSWQNWDLNIPANSPQGTQRAVLLVTLQWLPSPLEERPNSSPWPCLRQLPHLSLPSSYIDGRVSVLKSPKLRPILGPLHMLFLLPFCLQLPLSARLECHPSSLPAWTSWRMSSG